MLIDASQALQEKEKVNYQLVKQFELFFYKLLNFQEDLCNMVLVFGH